MRKIGWFADRGSRKKLRVGCCFNGKYFLRRFGCCIRLCCYSYKLEYCFSTFIVIGVVGFFLGWVILFNL